VIITNTGNRTLRARWIWSSCWDLRALAFERVGGVLDKRVGRDAKKHAVDRAIGAAGPQQLEKLAPLAGRAGVDFLEHQPPGRVEHDRVVGEPPVHVDRAADALELVLEPGRESHVAVPDGLGLAAARLADEHVPRQRVEVLAGGLELLDTALEVLADVVQPGAARGLGDSLRRGGEVVAEAPLHGLGLAPAEPPGQPVEQAHKQSDQDYADGEVIYVLRRADPVEQ